MMNAPDKVKVPEYNTPNKKKRFIEMEIRRRVDVVKRVNADYESYFVGVYGTRRREAIMNYLDRAEAEFKDFGLVSVVESFVANELNPFHNYNQLDEDYDLRIGTALWILERLRANGRLAEAYKILPDVDGNIDCLYLPPDFAHPCFANDLIQSVIYVISKRYDKNGGERHSNDVIITEGNAVRKKPGKTYLQLLELLPDDEVDHACSQFRSKVWELASRFLKGQGYYDQSIKDYMHDFEFVKRMGPSADGSRKVLPGLGGAPEELLAGEDTIGIAVRAQELIEKSNDYNIRFDQYLRMDRKKIRREAGSRDVAEALSGFTVEDPYELCFALFYLMDMGDDAPWLMRSGSSLMLYAMQMLPWFVEQDDWDDDDWEDWYNGLQYNRNGWMDQGDVEETIDYYHQKHGDRNLAQVIYDLCRTVVPVGLHPFEEDRKQLISEGMDEAIARKITDKAELMFLYEFQAKQRMDINFEINWNYESKNDEDDEGKREGNDHAKERDYVIEDIAIDDPVTKGAASEEAATKDPVTDGPATDEAASEVAVKARTATSVSNLGGYWGKVLGQRAKVDEDTIKTTGKTERLEGKVERAAGGAKRQIEAVDNYGNVDKLQMEMTEARKLIKSLRTALAVTRQEANNERTKYERELKALRMEHRELADLRELVFNQESDLDLDPDAKARGEKPEKKIDYPYETKKRTVVFGGHDNWLKSIRPMLPGVRFVDVEQYAFNPELIRNADVVWVQNNHISHTQYGNIVKQTRRHGIQLRYFGYASAEKCAEQLVVEDQKS